MFSVWALRMPSSHQGSRNPLLPPDIDEAVFFVDFDQITILSNKVMYNKPEWVMAKASMRIQLSSLKPSIRNLKKM